MQLLNAIAQRYSTRKYKDTPIEQEKIKLCIEAGRLAPSALNTQP